MTVIQTIGSIIVLAASFMTTINQLSEQAGASPGDLDAAVIGAGAAGLTAGFLLERAAVNFRIFEAADIHGGRAKKNDSFADFPIDLGGEWIHTDPSILAKLLNEPNRDASIEIIKYNPETIYLWKNNELKRRNLFSNFYSECSSSPTKRLCLPLEAGITACGVKAAKAEFETRATIKISMFFMLKF